MNKVKVKYKTLVQIATLLLMINIVGVTIFGVTPAVKSIKSKNSLLEQYKEVTDNLNTKIGIIEEMKARIDQVETYSTTLDRAIPNEESVENFVVNLALLSIKENGTIQKIIRVTSKENEINLNAYITFETIEKLQSFLDNLEEGDRMVKITDVNIQGKEEYYDLALSMTIFSTGARR